MMYGTAPDISYELENHFGKEEKIAVIVWSANDVRHYGQDYDPSEEEIESVLEFIAIAGEDGNRSVSTETITTWLEERWQEKQRNRSVAIPVKHLEIVMTLAKQEIERLAVCTENGGGDVAAFLADENTALKSIREAIEGKIE
ncbi:DUF1380 family protein [Pectobacterium brasiliense]|uniref:DUF1380 family protein n=1 Tax=Pectobacterium brasiliense TaxID=180957 RepID=UPI0019699858|nr:DUF1380 family protein [Pectobacterium brasiliense]MBN3263001.1 DUF1380 family protein [Pectobacterium brasiliense]